MILTTNTCNCLNTIIRSVTDQQRMLTPPGHIVDMKGDVNPNVAYIYLWGGTHHKYKYVRNKLNFLNMMHQCTLFKRNLTNLKAHKSSTFMFTRMKFSKYRPWAPVVPRLDCTGVHQCLPCYSQFSIPYKS
jgi:hypothetical protein